MKVERSEFLDIMDKVKPALGGDKLVSDFNYFVFTGEEIFASNGRIVISKEFKSNFSCAVSANDLIQVFQKTKNKNLSIDYDDKEGKFKIKAAGMNCLMSAFLYDPEQWDVVARKGVVWKKLPANFREGLLLTIFSCSKDMTKPYLNCLRISDHIISTDNIRISKYKLKGKTSLFLLPYSSAIELLKIENIVEYSLGDDFVMFRNAEGVTLYSSTMNVKYPDTSSFFEVFDDCKWITLPETLGDTIGLSGIFAEGDFDFDKKITLVFDENYILCSAKKDSGEIKCKVRVDTDFKTQIKIVINPLLFEQMLKYSACIAVHDNMLLFKAENFRHIMALYSGEY